MPERVICCTTTGSKGNENENRVSYLQPTKHSGDIQESFREHPVRVEVLLHIADTDTDSETDTDIEGHELAVCICPNLCKSYKMAFLNCLS
jgi:hypothetical protein